MNAPTLLEPAPAANGTTPEPAAQPLARALAPPVPIVRDEALKRAALRKMKRIALGALVGAAVGFALVHVFGRGYWWGLTGAFFEAAMVGALADWFAVTALFRYPLGVKIPHTAIIPENKDRIGNALANFVGQNFLSPENVLARLETVDFAEIAGEWLRTPGNVHTLRRRVVATVEEAVEGMGDERIGEFVAREVTPRLREMALAPKLSDLLLGLAKDNQHEAILDEVLKTAARLAVSQKETIGALIREQVPLFVPNGLVEMARDAAVRSIERTLEAMVADREHPLRLRVHEQVRTFIERLEYDEDLQAQVNAWRDRVLAHEAVQAFALERWRDLKAFLARDLRDEESAVFGFLEARAAELGTSMLEDEAFGRAVNEKVEAAAAWAMREHGHRLPELIRDTIRRWDAERVAEQIELTVGRDLQYIRLNGTLVGGLVGAILYLLTHAFPF